LSERTDTLVAYDEIGVGEAKAISAAMYQITAGTGKARLNRNARLREAMTWRGMLLSTGEVPVGTKIAEERGGRAYAGQQVRVLDLSADVGSGCGIFDADGLDENAGDLADRITSAASQHYGVAGLAFVRQLLVDGPEEVGALVAEMITAFEQAHLPANANGQVRRAARLLGLIGAAGELAAKWDVVPWQEGRSFDAAAKALADWIAQRGGLGAAEVHDGLEQVRTYMAMYGESRFDATDDADARTATTRAGWRRGSGEDRQWLILPSAWRDEICRGRNPQTIARALAERRMLLRDSEGRFQRSERTPLGQHRVYVVTASILEADNDDS
jgi:putative DNA primase/helicase